MRARTWHYNTSSKQNEQGGYIYYYTEGCKLRTLYVEEAQDIAQCTLKVLHELIKEGVILCPI